MTQPVEEVQGMVLGDLEVIEAKGDGWDPQGRMGLLAPWDQWALEDSLGRMDYPPRLAPLPPQGWGCHQYSMQI